MNDEIRDMVLKRKHQIEDSLAVVTISEEERERWAMMVEWLTDLLIAGDPIARKEQEDEEAKG